MSNTPAFYPSSEEAAEAAKAPWQWANVWQTVGWCRMDPEIDWFPDNAYEQRQLTKVCQSVCPVRKQCLTFALETGEHAGVWGGLTERELRKTAGLTPQGTHRMFPGLNVICPWCRSADLAMVEDHRVKCATCGFDWPGLVEDRSGDSKAESA